MPQTSLIVCVAIGAVVESFLVGTLLVIFSAATWLSLKRMHFNLTVVGTPGSRPVKYTKLLRIYIAKPLHFGAVFLLLCALLVRDALSLFISLIVD
jgi:hypothetical protein